MIDPSVLAAIGGLPGMAYALYSQERIARQRKEEERRKMQAFWTGLSGALSGSSMFSFELEAYFDIDEKYEHRYD